MKLFQKLGDLLMEATVSLARQYQEKIVELAKIEAAVFYIKGVRLLRKQCLMFAGFLFLMMLMVASFIIFPLAFLMCAPMENSMRLVYLAVLAGFYFLTPFLILAHFFSEKKWLEFFRSAQVVEKMTEQN